MLVQIYFEHVTYVTSYRNIVHHLPGRQLPRTHLGCPMDQLHAANKVCGGCCAISLNTVDTESSVSPTGTIPVNFSCKCKVTSMWISSNVGTHH